MNELVAAISILAVGVVGFCVLLGGYALGVHDAHLVDAEQAAVADADANAPSSEAAA